MELTANEIASATLPVLVKAKWDCIDYLSFLRDVIDPCDAGGHYEATEHQLLLILARLSEIDPLFA